MKITSKQSNNVKLYYFNPNDYGSQFFVCAESREKAIENVREFIERGKMNGARNII